MGIEDELIDLNTYTESLQQKISDVMDINKALRKYIFETDSASEQNVDNKNSLSDDIMSGLDF